MVEVGFHGLQHSFVSLCRQSNAPLVVVEAIVGHSNPAMTRHYTHVGDVAAGLAVAALPALGAGGASDQVSSDRAKEAVSAVGESDETLMAILREMKAETWERDRDARVALLRV